ncbi:zinc ABC transporter permease subunit ZnuB [Porticoccus sp. W117]|uniref:zinc ABC transporter permease subunit ZnuB n=1 Tax=Porticoccus sp. W117 TaxID=3054777 RepID=UPI0025996073|nr:zinc ABC transporter permease subunit ZnuB [Porticoccus sp. W117]MDM3870808.1 zinc ABC transporter permease subunit ZnuB [Porticoccus sp. W117]
MPEFLLLALLAGVSVAVASGPLGAFIVWRRMAYFGDTLAHSALFGTAIGVALQIVPTIAVMVVCLVLALLLVALMRQRQLAVDTLLGIMAHSSLALGMVAVALFPQVQIDLETLLFGDLLAVTQGDLLMIAAVALVVIVALWKLWRPLLAITIHEDLARVEGVPATAVRTALMLLIALTISIAMKVVGALLVTALLLIPAATARRMTRTPEQMAVGAIICGVLAVIAGLAMSWYLDTPAGPSIVISATALFLLGLIRPMSSHT